MLFHRHYSCFAFGVVFIIAISLTNCARGQPVSPTAYDQSIESEPQAFRFTPQELTSPAGVRITITVHNVHESDYEHQWVLLSGDKRIATELFDERATNGTPADRLPEYAIHPLEAAHVVAHTERLAPGQQEQLVLSTPPPGDYLYVCALPGHFSAGMFGTLHVTAPLREVPVL